MKQLKALLTNRVGIVLATINVCCMFCLYANPALFTMTPGKLFLAVNLPATIPMAAVGRLTSWYFLHPTLEAASTSILSLMIVVQWLLIAHVARAVSQFIDKKI